MIAIVIDKLCTGSLIKVILSAAVKDIPGASEHMFLIVRYCYRSFKQL